MAEEVGDGPPPGTGGIRLMNFVSQEQLDEAKRSRGERLEDGTAQRDRPLFEILKENKDKRDAEFNDRFKHRPPKALDQDETEFLDNLDSSRKEYERLIADQEAQQLRTFQAAVAAQSLTVQQFKEIPPVSNVQEDPKRMVGKKNQGGQPVGMIIKVKPQAKKAKVEESAGPQAGSNIKRLAEMQQQLGQQRAASQRDPLQRSEAEGNGENVNDVTKIGLVSYSDESEDD
ncbi:uncharacterized protein LOC141638198 [Silene latifolia]|uniref:uncharacterized protein LOC141638198 n=1 Tax=Silene latifolia TaxID=37657 RepID=UPI003D777CB6